MTTKKIAALVSIASLFLGNSLLMRMPEQSVNARMILLVTVFSTLGLLGVVFVACRNFRIALGAAAWWFCLSIASILIPLSTTLDNEDMGLTNFACLLLGAFFGYLGLILWATLPWDPLYEDGGQSSIKFGDSE
jgi:hypothetical protein